jgi:hypothetical protein
LEHVFHEYIQNNRIQQHLETEQDLKTSHQGYIASKQALQKNFPFLEDFMYLQTIQRPPSSDSPENNLDQEDNGRTPIQFKPTEFCSNPLELVQPQDDIANDILKVVRHYYETLGNPLNVQESGEETVDLLQQNSHDMNNAIANLFQERETNDEQDPFILCTPEVAWSTF